MRIIERKPNNTIKVEGDDSNSFKFFFWIQLKQVAENDTKIKLTLKANLNMMMQMAAKKPLQNGLNSIVDRMDEVFQKLG